MSAPAALAAASRPRFQGGVRLHFDRVREAWVILAPERVLFPDEIAVEVLRRCDGAASVEEIAGALAERFAADPATVRGDVLELLQDLADKGFVEA